MITYFVETDKRVNKSIIIVYALCQIKCPRHQCMAYNLFSIPHFCLSDLAT